MNRREAITALAALPGVASVATVTVQPTERIVIECDAALTDSARARMSEIASRAFGVDPARVVVFDRGCKMKIVRVEGAPA